ncbi:hypothetical protein KAU43_03595 [candidate division WOR-3 bacterium]|nr:hypothetical protein [candidate division WOR-3 bacterium]
MSKDIGQLHWSKAKQKYWIQYKDGTWAWIRQWYEQSKLSADREHFILHDYIYIQKQKSIHSEPPSKASKKKSDYSFIKSNKEAILSITFFITTLILMKLNDPYKIAGITFSISAFFLICYLIGITEINLFGDD